MHFIYGSRWNNHMRIMLDPVPVEVAKATYERGGEVSVACGRVPMTGVDPDDGEEVDEDATEPAEWVLYAALDRDFVEVRFMSFFGTREAEYSFRRQPDGRLFLFEVAEYDFAQRTVDTSDRDWSVMEEHSFDPDGTSRTVVRTMRTDGGQDVQMTEFRGGDFENHWEPVPTFGEWDSITRRQR